MDELTDRDVLLEILVLALKDGDMTAADVLEKLEQLGRSELIEEARAMQEILDEDEDEENGDDELDDPSAA